MAADKQPLHKRETPKSSVQPSEPLPKKKTCSGYHVYKVLSIIYSILFVLIGLLLCGLAVWIIIIKQEVQSLNDVVLGPVIMLLAVGIIIIATALVGCIGASCDKLWPLRIFLGIVIVVFILQVIIGILAYVYREETIQNFGERLVFGIKKYNDSAELRSAVDKVQRDGKCCGIEEPNDWDKNHLYACSSSDPRLACSVPDSCCIEEAPGCGLHVRRDGKKKLNDRGCKLTFKAWVERNLDAIGATALAMAIIHILGIFVVYMFITKVEDRIRLFKYRKRFYDSK